MSRLKNFGQCVASPNMDTILTTSKELFNKFLKKELTNQLILEHKSIADELEKKYAAAFENAKIK